MAEADLVVRRDRDALAATVAERLAGAVEAAIGRRGVAHVVLTGGSMGSAVVAATVAAAVQRPLPATGLHLWWGDERFLPVGGDKEVESDFQLIAGTNRDLQASVLEGRFRDDLLARLAQTRTARAS